MINKTDEREEYGLAGGGFDDGGFANSSCVQVDVGTLLCCFFLDVEI